jgi:hypothetical protein
VTPLKEAQEAFLERWLTQPLLGGALDRGLGKTRAAQRGMRLRWEIDRWLVLAPKRVANLVWRQEAEKWGEIDPGQVRVLTPADFGMTTDVPAVKPKGWQAGDLVFRDIRETRKYIRGLIGGFKYTVASWDWAGDLSEVLGSRVPFGGVVYDESGFVRTKTTERWQAARHLAAGADVRTALNATAYVKNWENVWAQSFLIDRGETFGRTLGDFRRDFLRPVGWGPGGYVRDYGDPTASQLEELQRRFHRLWLAIEKPDDMGLEYEIPCELDEEHWKAASKFLRGAIADCAGRSILPANAGVGWGKALQLCGGAVYDDGKPLKWLHRHKIDALLDLIEGAERGVMVLTWWKHHEAMVLEALGKHAVPTKDLERWIRGEAKVLVSHPRSVSHGLNLQDVGHTAVWFGLQPDADLYIQANGRFPRDGQTHAVMLPRLMSSHPAERAVWDVLSGRMGALEALMQYKDKL